MIVETKNGETLISDIINGDYFKRRFVGYTSIEATKLFREEFHDEYEKEKENVRLKRIT